MKTAVIILGALVATVLGKSTFISYITFQREREREREIIYCNFSHCTRVWCLSHQRAAKAKVSLRICADSPEPSQHACAKCGCRRRLRPKFEPLHCSSAGYANMGICAYAISNEIRSLSEYYVNLNWAFVQLQ